MEAQRAFTATVAFVVIAVSTEVTAPCVVFAVVSATEAAVDCFVALASSSYLFAKKTDCVAKAVFRAIAALSSAASIFLVAMAIFSAFPVCCALYTSK